MDGISKHTDSKVNILKDCVQHQLDLCYYKRKLKNYREKCITPKHLLKELLFLHQTVECSFCSNKSVIIFSPK